MVPDVYYRHWIHTRYQDVRQTVCWVSDGLLRTVLICSWGEPETKMMNFRTELWLEVRASVGWLRLVPVRLSCHEGL